MGWDGWDMAFHGSGCPGIWANYYDKNLNQQDFFWRGFPYSLTITTI